jgi:hypothetical protein
MCVVNCQTPKLPLHKLHGAVFEKQMDVVRDRACWLPILCPEFLMDIVLQSDVPSPEPNEAANKQRAREDGKRVAERAAEGKTGYVDTNPQYAAQDISGSLSF